MNRFTAKRSSRRRGGVLMEVLVAAGLVMTLLTVATPTVFHISRVWKHTRHVQLAHDELNAQLDRLVAMDDEARATAIDKLQVSPEIAAVLEDAALTCRRRDDASGDRLALSINWKRLGDPPPLTLVAWIRPLAASPEDSGAADPAGDSDSAVEPDSVPDQQDAPSDDRSGDKP